MRVRGLRRLIWYGAVAISLAACASSLPRNPVPLGLESDAAVVGMGGETIRFWGDVPPPNVDAMAKEKWAQVRASSPCASQGGRPAGRQLPGYFRRRRGRRLRCWRSCRLDPRGNRPEFDLVTGVSTGALTAPFAFLGPRYDDALKKVFTEFNHKRHCHRPAGQGTAWWGVAREQCAPRQSGRLLRQRRISQRGGRRAHERTAAPHRHHQSRRAAPGDLGHG